MHIQEDACHDTCLLQGNILYFVDEDKLSEDVDDRRDFLEHKSQAY